MRFQSFSAQPAPALSPRDLFVVKALEDVFPPHGETVFIFYMLMKKVDDLLESLKGFDLTVRFSPKTLSQKENESSLTFNVCMQKASTVFSVYSEVFVFANRVDVLEAEENDKNALDLTLPLESFLELSPYIPSLSLLSRMGGPVLLMPPFDDHECLDYFHQCFPGAKETMERAVLRFEFQDSGSSSSSDRKL